MKTEFSTSRSPVAGEDSPRPRWLVVDDTEAVLKLMAAVLERMGAAEICRSHSAAEALQQFAAAPERFTFVVTDFEMPGMNGAELCRRLHDLAPQLPVLLATGSTEITPAEARELGFCGLLFKPFPLEELTQAVARVLSRSAAVADLDSNHESALIA